MMHTTKTGEQPAGKDLFFVRGLHESLQPTCVIQKLKHLSVGLITGKLKGFITMRL